MGLCTCVRPLLARRPFVFLIRPAESLARRRRLNWRSHLALALELLPPRAKNWPLWHGVSDGGDPWSLIGGRQHWFLAVVHLGRGGPALALLKLNSLTTLGSSSAPELTDHSQTGSNLQSPSVLVHGPRARPLDRCWASALRCLIRCGKGRGIARAQTCWAPCNHSAPHCGPGQVPVRWAMSATGSCSRLQNTQPAAPATLACSGTCAGARPFAPSHQAYWCRAHRRPNPLRLPLLSLGLIRLSRSSSSFLLSPSPVFPFCRPLRFIVRNRLQAGLSLFFGIACQAPSHSFLRAASANQQQLSFIASARPVAHSLFFTRFSWFLGSSLDATSIDKATYLTNFLSFAGFAFGKKKRYHSV